MLEIKELCAFYGKKKVLSNISFNFESKTLNAVIGKNGSGKSTLLSCIGGMMNYSGTIEFCKKDLTKLKFDDRAKNVSLLPQILPSPHITVKELVMSGRSPYLGLIKTPDENDRKLCEKSMELLGISHLANCFSDSISGGERQKAYLAMMLCQKTPLMLLDEPTTYMDISYANELLGLLKSIVTDEGKTVLCVMHDINLALRYADNIAVIDNGSCLFSGSVTELLETELLESVFAVKRFCDKNTVFFS